MISLNRVSVAFQTQSGIHYALQDVALTVRPGEWVAVVGANGSGKSTCGRVLAGLTPLSSGSRNTTWERPGDILMILQNPDAQIIGDTVWEDVCFGLHNLGVPAEEVSPRAMAALAKVGLVDQRDASVHSLSGGQKQRLCIAACLAMSPRLLIFDEATTMLDPARRTDLLQLTRQLHAQGLAIVWITQDMGEAAFADRIVALANGRLVFDGTPAAFFYGHPCKCTELGFELPYVVQIGRALAARGIALSAALFTTADLSRLMGALACP
ncbi:MAG: ATP-binding cassette domain-containing protein [Alicyclobacillus sp.]|nr:ATP-binding cassette domain-containing protein [Alicyclobacillus sp.]